MLLNVEENRSTNLAGIIRNVIMLPIGKSNVVSPLLLHGLV